MSNKVLLIVESPSKAQTIGKYLGKNFTVKSSVGHIRDLDRGDQGVDVKNNFEPKYVVSPDKKKVVADLKKAIAKVDEVWLATDDDREGEAIAWHLCEVLKLDPEETKRIVFREITKPAIEKAVESPRTVDINLVNAQQARRVLDRLVGFELSPLLWRKVKAGLSAGRVQSVALKLVVEREKEIRDFKTETFYRIKAVFDVENERGEVVALEAKHPGRFDSEEAAREFLNKCIGADFTINDIQEKPSKRYPAQPFITSSLQMEASRRLYMQPKFTMSTAQKLYEKGLITYMRTDSTNLSEQAIYHVGEYVKKEYGEEYHQARRASNKTKGAQEAHEAIRPTDIRVENISGDRDMQRLYDLIRKRTIASQMAPAEIEKTTVHIGISTLKGEELRAEGEVLKFEGFMKVYMESVEEDEKGDDSAMLPPLKVGQLLDMSSMEAKQSFTRLPVRYSNASLIKELEDKGIGRPSTYAPTMDKITDEKRGYIEVKSTDGEKREYTVLKLAGTEISKVTETETTGAVKNRLFATDLGILVTDFLEEHFEKIMDYGFTADIEEKFDVISDGKLEWKKFIANFYAPFHENVAETMEDSGRATGERILGTDPASGKTVLTRMSRFGPVVQIGKPEELPEGEKPQYASLLESQSMNTIEFDEAMDLFKLPRGLGSYKGETVQINVGRFGPYLKFGKKNISVPKGTNVLEISLAEAQEYIDQRLKEEEPIGYYKDLPIQQGAGRFGPFVKWDDKFFSIGKKYDPASMDETTAIVIIEEKLKRDAEKIIHSWPEHNITVEMGRWGPFVRYGKENIRIPQKDKQKVDRDAALEMTLEEFMKIVKEKFPDAFTKKKTPPKKK